MTRERESRENRGQAEGDDAAEGEDRERILRESREASLRAEGGGSADEEEIRRAAREDGGGG